MLPMFSMPPKRANHQASRIVGDSVLGHVLIVGGGPAGASLAYLLVHRGIRVTLLERQSDFER